MRTNLSTRYSDDLLLLLSKAAFLDPRLKTLPFLSSTETEELHKSIKQEAVQLAESAPANVEKVH